jgi:PTS system ascorbate-specific IIA component
MTSGEIAKTLGDVGVPVRVIDNFTSTREIDTALRESYDI